MHFFSKLDGVGPVDKDPQPSSSTTLSKKGRRIIGPFHHYIEHFGAEAWSQGYIMDKLHEESIETFRPQHPWAGQNKVRGRAEGVLRLKKFCETEIDKIYNNIYRRAKFVNFANKTGRF